MNETLYRWTFNFHKVVRQQNSGAVEDFILPYSAVYLRIHKLKELLKSVHIFQSYRKNNSGTLFMAHGGHWMQLEDARSKTSMLTHKAQDNELTRTVVTNRMS